MTTESRLLKRISQLEARLNSLEDRFVSGAKMSVEGEKVARNGFEVTHCHCPDHKEPHTHYIPPKEETASPLAEKLYQADADGTYIPLGQRDVGIKSQYEALAKIAHSHYSAEIAKARLEGYKQAWAEVNKQVMEALKDNT